MKKALLILALTFTSLVAQESFWDKVKSGASSTWEKTKDAVDDAKDSETADKIKEGSSNAWEKTKEYSGKAWDASKEKYKEVTDD